MKVIRKKVMFQIIYFFIQPSSMNNDYRCQLRYGIINATTPSPIAHHANDFRGVAKPINPKITPIPPNQSGA